MGEVKTKDESRDGLPVRKDKMDDVRWRRKKRKKGGRRLETLVVCTVRNTH